MGSGSSDGSPWVGGVEAPTSRPMGVGIHGSSGGWNPIFWRNYGVLLASCPRSPAFNVQLGWSKDMISRHTLDQPSRALRKTPLCHKTLLQNPPLLPHRGQAHRHRRTLTGQETSICGDGVQEIGGTSSFAHKCMLRHAKTCPPSDIPQCMCTDYGIATHSPIPNQEGRKGREGLAALL